MEAGGQVQAPEILVPGKEVLVPSGQVWVSPTVDLGIKTSVPNGTWSRSFSP